MKALERQLDLKAIYVDIADQDPSNKLEQQTGLGVLIYDHRKLAIMRFIRSCPGERSWREIYDPH